METLKRDLRFECQKCGYCCRHEPGYVFLTASDLKKLTGFLGMRPDEFLASKCRRIEFPTGAKWSLLEKDNNDCVFWESGGCSVYEARPLQCRTYPFWSSVIRNEQSWEEESRSCPGINKGPLISSDKYRKYSQEKEFTPLI
jgi:Fe-S-cluster containining protein